MISSIKRWPARLALALISLYQRTLSPDHGLMRPWFPHGGCRFHPSCSVYTTDAIRAYGLMRGTQLGVRRLMRCHPWSLGGYDPVQ